MEKKLQATSPEQTKIVQRYEWKNLTDFTIYCSFAVMALFGWGLTPWLDNKMYGDDRILPMEAWYPYNKYAYPMYEITYVQQMLAISMTALSNIMHDVLVASLISTASCHLELLMLDLRSVANPPEGKEHIQLDPIDNLQLQMNRIAASRNAEMSANLNECIKYHEQIYQITQIIEKVTNPAAFAQFSISSVVICVSLYQLSSQTSISLLASFSIVMYMGCMVWQVFLYCWHGNELMLNSSRVNMAAYDCSWYNCTTKFKTSIRLIMCRSLRPIKLTAGSFVTLSLETYVAIIKASYSFFTVLDQANK